MNLTEALKPDLIKIPLTGKGKTGVITELLEWLSQHHSLEDSQKVLAQILEREEIMTTGVGNGVAIPHCKTNTVTDFVIALGIHPGGVAFKSLDGKPAHIIFMLVGPDSQPGAHIRLLSRISRIISDNATREAILSCDSPEEIYKLLAEKERLLLEVIS
ncbi:MAG TPA: PTS sugar transporter subunit IIA [Calditrichia bacterium]|nr:PTS sugar transporter subunit IIA [Calditrichota bacterium]HQV30242.1 PTS sugar transporter subunit IIA [Calditrichia bacterium]